MSVLVCFVWLHIFARFSYICYIFQVSFFIWITYGWINIKRCLCLFGLTKLFIFVSLWTDKFLNFKYHTTNRVESQHSNLKLRLSSSKCNLQTFVFHIDQVVQQQYIELEKSFERNRIVVKHRQKYPNFQLLFGYVSTNAIDLIMKELKRSNSLELDNENCGRQLWTSCGLPCACEIAVYFNLG